MAKKRGGLAGLYDRNKGKFRTVGTLVGTGLGALVGGPAGAKIGGTLAGAAFRGFDREGKGGIGFDVSQGLQGAAEGYGTAALATSAYGGAKNLLSPSGSNPSVLAKQIGMTPSATTGPAPVTNVASGVADAARNVPSLMGTGGPVTSTDYIGRSVNQFLAQGGSTAPSASGAFGRAAADRAFGDLGMSLGDVANAGKNAGSGIKGLLNPPMTFGQALKQPQVLAGGVQGLLGMLPDAKSAAMEEQTKLGQGQLALQQAQFEEEKRRAQMEEERRRKIAELLMPYMQQSFPQYFGGR